MSNRARTALLETASGTTQDAVSPSTDKVAVPDHTTAPSLSRRAKTGAGTQGWSSPRESRCPRVRALS